MAINLSDNIKISGPLPVDSRYFNNLVPYTSTGETNSVIVSGERYVGLTVNINNVEYWYASGTTDTDLVIKTMGGAGTITGATNGLSLVNSGTTVVLGGTLTSDVMIDSGGYGFEISGGTSEFILEPAGITLAYSGTSVNLDSNAGLTYTGDYSDNYIPRSLVDKEYVDIAISAATSGITGTLTGATNGLHVEGMNVALGGDLTGNTTISGLDAHALNLINFSNFQISTTGSSVSFSSTEGLIYGSGYTSSNDFWIPTKLYVDGVAIGLNVHEAVFVATTGYTILSGLTIVDGVQTTAGMRVLVKNQGVGTSGHTDNGIYIASASAWTRSVDYNFNPPISEIANGDLIPVTSGVTQYNSLWAQTAQNPIVSGSTPLNFTLFSMPTKFLAGTGININVNTISVDGASLDGNSILWSGNTFNVDVNSGGLQTALAEKLDVLTFTGYTANTQQFLDIVITGATNVGVGTGIYDSKSGNTLNFNSIVGSGTTTISQSGNTIVIYSSGGTGNGSVTGATNGLDTILSGTTVILGGALIQNTAITLGNKTLCIGQGNNQLTLTSGYTSLYHFKSNGIDFSDINVSPTLSQLSTTNNTSDKYASVTTNDSGHVLLYTCCSPSTPFVVLRLSPSDLLISGDSATFAGAQYGDNYCSNFTSLSIPHVGYVTGYTQSAITQNLNTVNVCNVTANYSATTLNDFIGVSGATLIYLPESPKPCQRISVADIMGDALGNNITICSEGKSINGNPTATINTDYGSITFINNGFAWSAVSFIN
jgi:hypothetical protein